MQNFNEYDFYKAKARDIALAITTTIRAECLSKNAYDMDKTSAIIDKYTGKVASKLAMILMNRGEVSSYGVERYDIGEDSFDVTLNLTFADGSTFKFNTKDVKGKYTSRFLDVYDSEKEKVRYPSYSKVLGT